MNFLKKILGSSVKKKTIKTTGNPDNTRLIYSLNIYASNPSRENYAAVLDEITNGNSFLLLPSVNNHIQTNEWKTLETGATLNLTSVFNLDGLKVLGAFSDETALVNWTNQPTEYTSIKCQDLIEFCKENSIDRIVINSDQKNMFVLERNTENITARTIQEETKVMIGTPIKPLPKSVVDLLCKNFKRVDTVEEAYQFAQVMNEESSLVLGIKMSIISDNSRAALNNVLNDSLIGVDVGMPIDIMLLDNEQWLNTARNVEGSFIYKR